MRSQAKAPTAGPNERQLNRARLAFAGLGLTLLVSIAIVASAGASKGVLAFFGSEGTGDGQLGTPAGVAVNSTGNGSGADAGDVYAVDNGNDRIVQFSDTGAFVRAFGWGVGDGSDAFQVCTSGCQAAVAPSSPSAAGSLNSPQGIAIDADNGNLFVSDTADRRINVYGSDGSFQGAIGWGVDTGAAAVEFCTTVSGCQAAASAGAAAGQIGSSTGYVAIDPTNGDVLLAERTNRRIARWSLTLNGSEEVTGASFVKAAGWDVDPAGLVDEFEICTVATTCRAGQTPAPTTSPGKFPNNQPVKIAVDSTGAIYVNNGSGVVSNPARIEKLTPAGESYTPATFAPGILTGTLTLADVAIGASDNLFVNMGFAAGATPSCPDGEPSKGERRIVELDSAGAELLDTHMSCARVTTVSGIALDATAGRIYASSTTGGNRVYALDDVPPATVTIDPVTDQTATTATFSGEVNPNGAPTGYRFEYSADGGSTWAPTASPNIDLGSGTSPVDVESARVGLSPNTAYQVRLVAEHPFNAGRTDSSVASFTTDAAPPTVSTAASVAGTESLELHSLVNPQGSNVTDCTFHWGTTSSYGNSVPCDSLPGGGVKPQLVSADLNGLSSGAYHYRLSVTSAAGATTGPDREIEVGSALPDNRAWEMVSPPDKNGGNVMVDVRRSRAAQELAPGQPMAFNFASLSGFAGAEGSGLSVDYISVRGSDRWRTHAITPRQDPVEPLAQLDVKPLYNGEFSADLSRGVFRSNPSRDPLTPDSGPVSKVQNLYLRSDLREPGSGIYSLQTSCPRCLEETPTGSLASDFNYTPRISGATDDFHHVIFTSEKVLTADALSEQSPLCQGFEMSCNAQAYEAVGGTVRLVGRVPASGDRCDDINGTQCVAAPHSEGGAGHGTFNPHPISTDGSRILFKAGEQFYIRFGGRATVRVNASEKSVPDESLGAHMYGIGSVTPDLSHAFFTTEEQLVESDNDTCRDLYRYQVAPLGPDGLPDPAVSHLTRISVDEEPADGLCARAVGTPGFSDDGRTVYFLSQHRQLVAGAPLPQLKKEGNTPLEVDVLYAWRDGHVRYLGILGPASSTLNNGHSTGGFSNALARVTPDGSHLFFASRGGEFLTDYDHGASCIGENDENTGGPCVEFYLYDYEANGGAGEVVCVSCVPDGTPATSTPTTNSWRYSGGDNTTSHLNHALTDDGRYVFFDSPERLVPTDTNGKRDVYRYDSVEGNLKLLSGAGEEADESYFLDSGRGGRDVFFATGAQLSGWDYDGAYDVYDARIDGGLPEPPAPVPSCLGDACQPAPRDLDDPTPSSSTSVGKGNLKEGRAPSARRCPKGKRRVKARSGKSRCVPRTKGRNRNRTNANRRAGR